MKPTLTIYKAGNGYAVITEDEADVIEEEGPYHETLPTPEVKALVSLLHHVCYHLAEGTSKHDRFQIQLRLWDCLKSVEVET